LTAMSDDLKASAFTRQHKQKMAEIRKCSKCCTRRITWKEKGNELLNLGSQMSLKGQSTFAAVSIRWVNVNWFHLTQDRDKWMALQNTFNKI